MPANNQGRPNLLSAMHAVIRQPASVAREVAWRWLAGIAVLLLAAPIVLGTLGMDIHLTGTSYVIAPPNVSALQGVTIFQPVAAARTLQSIVVAFLSPALPLLRWIVPSCFFLWLIIAAIGRTIVLRRLDPTLHARRLTLFLLGTLRALLLLAAWSLWFYSVAYAIRTTITIPAAHNQEPNLVLLSAMLICGTLILYVLWAVFSWFLQLAPLLAMQLNLGTVASLRAALSSPRKLRGELIEINLVMNIVRIALIVLAMVLSASPLAFQTVATQQFFEIWWAIAILLYLAASDYFHVVRAAAYLSLCRAHNFNPVG